MRAIVNDAGYDLFDPTAPSFAMMRGMFGGRPDATEADPDAMQRMFDGNDEMRASFRLMQADQDGAQGAGYWKRYLQLAFERLMAAQGYTFAELGAIATPTLILVGDRDQFCTVEQAAVAFLRERLTVVPV